MIPTKKQRKEWRELAENTSMVSAVGEYTPEEFIILLNAVDELETKLEGIKKAVLEVCMISQVKHIFKNLNDT